LERIYEYDTLAAIINDFAYDPVNRSY